MSKFSEEKNKLNDNWFLEKSEKFGNSPILDELAKLSQEQESWENKYDRESKELWESLDEDSQLKLFYWVVKNITEGELIDKGTYRWILYEKFKFNEQAYSIGINSGFMRLHKSINQDKNEN
jgi:hypothetical protein